MVLHDIKSRQATEAVREAEQIIRSKAWRLGKSAQPRASRRIRQRLIHGFLIVLFLVFCFLPAFVILALAALGIALAR